ncbi:MAG: 4Fe-4S dicluster domain-containing protein, partial [Nitrososphaeria archaeon]|nr:4Fe-4S dicluster domain-containing protein [Nitrososphaeria archaeon]
MVDCTQCGLCTSACPVVSLVGMKEFAGPMAYVALATRALDPRDEGARAYTMVDNGIFQCTSCLRCGDVCPQGIYPFEDAIEPLMRIAVTEKAYRMSRHYTAFKEALLESGDVNPLVLM